MAPFLTAERRRAIRAELDSSNKEHGVDQRTASHGFPALEALVAWPKCLHCDHPLHVATKRNASLGVPPIPLPPLYWRARQCLACKHTFMIGVSEDGITVERAPVKSKSTWKREAKYLTETMGQEAYRAAVDAEVQRRQERAQIRSDLADAKLQALVHTLDIPDTPAEVRRDRRGLENLKHIEPAAYGAPEPLQRVMPEPGPEPIPEPQVAPSPVPVPAFDYEEFAQFVRDDMAKPDPSPPKPWWATAEWVSEDEHEED